MAEGKMIYDGSIEVRAIEEDLGPAITESRSERGKWPSCFGGESLRPPNPPRYLLHTGRKSALAASIPCFG